jgi:hypothetical protein
LYATVPYATNVNITTNNKMKKIYKKFKKLILSIFIIIIIAVFGFIFWPEFEKTAEATWWNDQWSYRKALTINSDQVAGDLVDFPMLVSLTDTDLGAHAQEDGDDFIFVDREGNKLKHEIESYASSTGVLVAWVKIPSLSSTDDTDIFMYYGNAGVADQSEAESVWDENYIGVWHFNDSGDSTSYNKSWAVDNGVATSISKINGGYNFPFAYDYVEQADSSIYRFNGDITVSFWMQGNNFNNSSTTIIFNLANWNEKAGFVFADNGQYTDEFFFRVMGGGNYYDATTSRATVNDGVWHYIVGRRSGTDTNLYVDGNLESTVSSTEFDICTTTQLRAGWSGDTTPADFNMDDTRISNSARSDAWIQTEYNNQNNPSAFFAEGAEETGPGPVGYWSFDEGYGTTAHDESGQGNDGAITGALWKGEEECVSGKCLYFDGLDSGNGDYVSLPFSSSMSSSEFTINAWIKKATSSKQQSIFHNGNWYSMHIFSSDKTRFLTGDYSDSLYSDKVLNNNDWYYLSMTRESNGTAKTYINGTLEKTDNLDAMTMSGTSYIGCVDDGYGLCFNGYIDDVKIYPYARSVDQIKQDYLAGSAGISAASGVSASFGASSQSWMSNGLVGYWKFDESATTTGAIDMSGNGNTGTYYGDASTTAGKYGNGGVFDGDDYIQLSTGELIAQNTISFTAWVKASSTTGTLYVQNDDAGFVSHHMRITSGYLQYDNWYPDNGWIQGQSQLPQNEWAHVSIVRNGNMVTFYINGEYDGEGIGEQRESAQFVERTLLGARLYSSAVQEGFSGQIDEVRIYNRALSPSEVKKLYEWAPGPVAHWKFDEMEGTTAYDSVASSSTAGGNDGTFSGSPQWTRGKYGGALSFDGNDDYIDIAESADLRPSKMTLSFWFQTSETSAQYMVVHEKTLWSSWHVEINGSGNIASHFGTNSANTDGPYPFSTNVYNDGQWHHVATTYDETTALMYIDGIEQASDSTDNGAIVYEDDDDAHWHTHIGSHTYGPTPTIELPFNGLIDDVRIYNYARTQKQILEDMAGGPGLAQKQPVLHLSFDEGYGGTAYDSSIHGNNGLLYPGTTGDNTSSSSMWTKNGRVNGAMEFDGDSDRVVIQNSDSIDSVENTNEFTVSVWFNTNEISVPQDTQTIIENGDDSDWNVMMVVPWNDSSVICYMIHSSGGDHQHSVQTTTGSISINTWHLASCIYDGENLKIAIDGEIKVAEDIGSGHILRNTEEPFRVGNKYTTEDTLFFNGMIDEVKVWNYALTEDEIKTEYNHGSSLFVETQSSANNDGATVTGASTEYCVPGDTAQCDPPVLELKFDELAGTTTYDTSGNGNDGVFVSADSSPKWSRGKLGGGLKFDGADDYVDAGTGSTLNLDNLTITAWIKTATSGAGVIQNIVNKSSGGNATTQYEIRLNNANLEFIVGNGSTRLTSSITGLAKNLWYFVSGSFDGAELVVYNNAISGAPTVFSGIQGTTPASLQIGVRNNNQGFFDGLIDHVKIYNYARTPAQIAWDYNKGAPIAHWRFDECSGGTIHDESGNGNHGQLYLGTSGVTATGTCASSSDSFWYNGKDGKYNSSGSFDGGDDYVDCGNDDILKPTTAISIAAWVKADSLTNYERVVDYTDSTGALAHGYRLQYAYTTNKWAFLLGGGSPIAVYSGIAAIPNEWVFLTATWDGNNMKLYTNAGTPSVNTNFSGPITYTNTINLNIGNVRGAANHWDGLIDEVKIWNYALTAEQVKQEYNGGAVRFGN